MATIKQLLRLTYFPLGFLVGWFFFETIISRLKLGEEINHYLLWSTAITCAVLFAIGPELRCVCLVAIPHLAGKNGRRLLATWLIAIVIAGPMANIQENIRESSDSFTCFRQLAENRTRKMHQLLHGPAVLLMQSLHKNQNKLQEIGDVLAAGGDKNISALEKYRNISRDYRSLLNRTSRGNIATDSDIPDEITLSCAPAVQNIGCDCSAGSSQVPPIGICSVSDEAAQRCRKTQAEAIGQCKDREKQVDFGKKLKAFDGASASMEADFKSNFTLDIKTDINLSFNASVPLKLEIRQLARRRKAFLEAMRTVYTYFVSLLLFLSVLSAYSYWKKYQTRITFDNLYITKYFDHIDERRRRQGKVTVIPLKDLDRRPDLIRPNRLKLAPPEKKRMRSNLIFWFLVILLLANILYVDHLISFSLASFERHANITFYDSGSHNVTVHVIGTGPMAEIIREVYGTFNNSQILNSIETSDVCLPSPHFVSASEYWELLLILFLWLLLNFTDAYLLRMKRSVCAFFYPERERARNLDLYNSVLKSRKKGLKYMLNRFYKDKAAGRIADHKLVGVCQLCQEIPPATETEVCEECRDQHQRESLYCSQCWRTIRKHCLRCQDWRQAASLHSMQTEDKASRFLHSN